MGLFVMPASTEITKKVFWQKMIDKFGLEEAGKMAGGTESIKKWLGIDVGKKVINPVVKSTSPSINEVFEKGVQNFSKEELESAISNARTKVFRYDRYAPELMEKGFSKELSSNPPLAGEDLEYYLLNKAGLKPEELHKMVRTGKFTQEAIDVMNDWSKYKSSTPFDEPGLYWGQMKQYFDITTNKHRMGPDVNAIPPYQARGKESLITGALNPKAIPGIDVLFRGSDEVIQKEPGQVLAKYGDLFKIIGLGGATSLGSQLIPNEAEAEPISGRIGKTMVKELAETVGKSSAAKKLIGKEVDGRIVKDVIKGLFDWRYILFEDGSRLPVRKNVLADIMKETGTQSKIAELQAKETESSKLQQAYKSLQFHLQRQEPLVNKAEKEAWRKEYSKYMNETKLKEVTWTYVESHNVYLPEEYAKILEDAGVIKIKKGK